MTRPELGEPMRRSVKPVLGFFIFVCATLFAVVMVCIGYLVSA